MIIIAHTGPFSVCARVTNKQRQQHKIATHHRIYHAVRHYYTARGAAPSMTYTVTSILRIIRITTVVLLAASANTVAAGCSSAHRTYAKNKTCKEAPRTSPTLRETDWRRRRRAPHQQQQQVPSVCPTRAHTCFFVCVVLCCIVSRLTHTHTQPRARQQRRGER